MIIMIMIHRVPRDVARSAPGWRGASSYMLVCYITLRSVSINLIFEFSI